MVESVRGTYLTFNQILWSLLPALEPPIDRFHHLAFEGSVVPERTKNLTLLDQVLFLILVEH